MGAIRSESATSSPRLTIELVPKSSWYDNVRSQVDKKTWDILRRYQYQLANHRCQICTESGLDQGFKHAVECHEIWEYDDKNFKQTLTGLIALCPLCHKVKHAGRVAATGTAQDMLDILTRLHQINDMDHAEAYRYVFNAFRQWSWRSRHKWTVDVSILNQLIENSKSIYATITMRKKR